MVKAREVVNPWREKLGCEVGCCQAKQCDMGRLRICALRKAWLDLTEILVRKMDSARSEGVKRVYRKRLEGMGWKRETGE